jgi:predicted nucleic acid-binding protein
MHAKVFYDSNILVYAYSSDTPEKQRIAHEVIEDGMRYGIGVISPQVLGEFFVTITRKAKVPMSPEIARMEIENLQGLDVVTSDRALVLQAINLQTRFQVHYWDAMIIASAQRANCRTILSEDLAHGQKYGELEVKNPFILSKHKK